MKWIDKLSKWDLTSLKLNLKFAEIEFAYTKYDEVAAWEMYVELITRITTRPLSLEDGDDKSALESVHSLFSSTRELLKAHGRKGQTFSKLAIIVLNQIIRPFTTKWHRCLAGGFSENESMRFREDLICVQIELSKYAKALSEIANVEDISSIEQ